MRRLSLHEHDADCIDFEGEVDPTRPSLVVSSDVRLDGSDGTTIGTAVHDSFLDCSALRVSHK